ncbi:anoctamin-4 isoform X2 [Culicoides brevitarsis]|uniref:anoctamin-4 isoform X2 n=1 Tax=Culicoides brevitarsis TaxID=469753 RepID=UPI00307C6CA5
MDEFLKNERTEEKNDPEEHPFSTSFDGTTTDTSVPTLFQEQFVKLRKKLPASEQDELKISLTDLCGDDDKLKNEWELRRSGTRSTIGQPIQRASEDFDIASESNLSLNTNYTKSNVDPDINENLAMIEMRETFKERPIDEYDPTLDCPDNPFGENRVNPSLYFNDGERSVDFVLVWREDFAESPGREERASKRDVFEANLMNEGLDLEHELVEDEFHFVKVHATVEVLRRYAEILKLRMPMRESLCRVQKSRDSQSNMILNAAQYVTQKIPGVARSTETVLETIKKTWRHMLEVITVDEKTFPKRSHRFTAIYSRDKEYLFDLSQPNFFTSAVRSRIVQFILDRKKFTREPKNDFAFGVQRLIAEGAYIAAYPLHDGEINVPGSMRYKLYTKWASVKRWYRYQPLDYIKDYFGVKIAIYFAWLGFYTYMLLLAAIVGVGCFIYSWSTLDSYKVSKEICDKDSKIMMCPICDYWCDYWKLEETCTHSKFTYLIDNPSTVFFAVFMSFWGSLFLELWKRYSAEITHRWDLTGFDVHEEHPRPQYLARLAHVRKKKVNAVTNTEEPQVPFWRMKLPATLFSFSVVLLLIVLAFAAVLGVVLYRMSVLATISVYRSDITTSWANIFTSATAASINLTLIVVFNWLYSYLAEYLTELELNRTQTEFDDSLTLKIYLLQFVNYYSSIFYIAFFKGKFVGYPGGYWRFFGYRQEECMLGGCLIELCLQLGIIMIGKQTMNTIIEMGLPIFWKWYNSMKVRIGKNYKTSLKGKGQRWLKDLKLIDWDSRSLFPEYLEMVLQYGFVTIFVSAFPLAPFFALLNNIFETRLDAKKLLTYHKRPVSQRVKDIGIWYRILDSIGKLSVITNGFIIAFTSDFIPRLIYRLFYSQDGTLNGYLDFTLATFKVNDLEARSQPHLTEYHNLTTCRYHDFRQPEFPYAHTSMYWIILAARLGFVVLFENVVAFVMILVRWCIPDMSTELRDQIRREAYITNEIIIKQETLRAKEERRCPSTQLRNRKSPSRTASMLKWERIAASAMSGSELDLELHYDDQMNDESHKKTDGYPLQTFV